MRDLTCALMLAIALASCCAPIRAEGVERIRRRMSTPEAEEALPVATTAFLLSFALFIGAQSIASIYLRHDLRELDARVQGVEWIASRKSASLEVARR